jgi:hypothetical protein
MTARRGRPPEDERAPRLTREALLRVDVPLQRFFCRSTPGFAIRSRLGAADH